MKTLKVTRRVWMRSILYSSVALIGGAGYISSRRLEIVREDVLLSGLSPRLDGLKIGVMSDFHAGAFVHKKDIWDSVHTVNHERPELVVLIGDFVDGGDRHSSENVEKESYVFEALKALKAPLGLFAVLGNHDHWTDARLVRKELSRIGVVVLDDRHVPLEHGLAVAGVDDFWEGPARPIKALGDLSRSTPVILLSHNPDVNMQLGEDRRVRLVISGHTHGGQIRIPLINRAPWVPCSKKYRGATGLIPETAHRWTFITKGVGTFFLPIRLACPPDIGILRLRTL
ncbi:MAG: metallophosphoesterase [Desulfobacteraceae bacterium]|jgi:predicted MPP superfamily phosphohydrolase